MFKHVKEFALLVGQVPCSTAASLPVGSSVMARAASPDGTEVVRVAERATKRLHALSQPHWGGGGNYDTYTYIPVVCKVYM